tara:strand:+ start:70 stop:573 length:504 start_codon:yes stop_codon:yes gene_type:complete
MSYDNYIIVGKILTTHGIKGYMTIKSFTKIPSDIFKYTLYIKNDKNITDIKIEDHNFLPKKTIMKVEGIDSIEDSQKYIGLDLLVPKADLPKTEPNEYYWYELIGSSVINSHNEQLGEITDIFISGDNDILVVKKKHSSNKIFIPFLKDTIMSFKDNILTVRWDNEV